MHKESGISFTIPYQEPIGLCNLYAINFKLLIHLLHCEKVRIIMESQISFKNEKYEKLDFSLSQLYKKLLFVDLKKKRLVWCHLKIVTLPRKSRTFIHWGIGLHEKYKPKN